jgi:hypothetical protein
VPSPAGPEPAFRNAEKVDASSGTEQPSRLALTNPSTWPATGEAGRGVDGIGLGSWGVPFYEHHGELAGFAAYENHVSFGFGAGVLEDRDRTMLEERGHKLGKVTMQIKFDQQVPTAAIKKILEAKAKLNEAKSATR